MTEQVVEQDSAQMIDAEHADLQNLIHEALDTAKTNGLIEFVSGDAIDLGATIGDEVWDAGYRRDTDTDPDESDSGTPSEAKAARPLGRAQIRRIVTKGLELAAAEPDHVSILASVLGEPGETVALTAAVLGAPRGALALLERLDDLRTAGALEAGVTVMALERSEVRALWSLTASLGADLAPVPPSNDVKAAIALVGAIGALPDSAATTIAAVRSLARKG